MDFNLKFDANIWIWIEFFKIQSMTILDQG